MKAGYWLGGQSQLECCAKCLNSPDKLIKNWEAVKVEFSANNTLDYVVFKQGLLAWLRCKKNKAWLIAMYVPWELCDKTFTQWNKNNPIGWPDPKTLGCDTT